MVARIVVGQKIDLFYADVVLPQEINNLVHKSFVGIDPIDGWDADADRSAVLIQLL